MLFLAAGTTDTKFRRSTGLTTANSTNKYQKYKSVELGDQLVIREIQGGMGRDGWVGEAPYGSIGRITFRKMTGIGYYWAKLVKVTWLLQISSQFVKTVGGSSIVTKR